MSFRKGICWREFPAHTGMALLAAHSAAGADAPPSRDLTGLIGVRVEIYEVPKSDPDIVYIGLNDRDKAWHDLYKLRSSTGEKTPGR